MDESKLAIREALQTIRLFSDALSPDQLDALAGQCSPIFFSAGSILIRQGNPAASMFCIIDGTVRVTHVDKHSRSNEIRQLSAGSVVGERELLTGERRVATVTALTDLNALEVSKAVLDNLLASAPDLLENFRATYEIRDAILRQIVPERGWSRTGRLLAKIRRIFAPRDKR